MSEAVKTDPKDKKKTHAFYVTDKEAKKLKEVLELMRKNEGKW